jgi:hypothetical protein
MITDYFTKNDLEAESKLYMPLRYKGELILLSYSIIINRLVSIRLYIPSERKGYADVDDLISLNKGSLGVSILERGHSPDTHEFFKNVLEEGEYLEQYDCRIFLPTKSNINYILNNVLERRYKVKFNVDFLKDFYNSKKNVWYCNEETYLAVDEESLNSALEDNIEEYKDIYIQSPYLKNRYADYYKVIKKYLEFKSKANELTTTEIIKPNIVINISFHSVTKKEYVRLGKKITKQTIDDSKTYTKTFSFKELVKFLQSKGIESYIQVSKTFE